MIKKIIILASVSSLLILGACKKNEEANSEQHSAISNPAEIGIPDMEKRVIPKDGKYPVMTFATKDHDFGTIEALSLIHI
jgi:hypothetical protein